MTHDAQAGSRSILGQNFLVLFDGIPAGVAHIAWLLGFTQATTSLGSLGAPGCALLHSNDLAWTGAAIPGGPVGGTLGVVVSNGLTINFGGF